MRGRKPKPSVLRALQGNPGHRPLNVAEPQHPPLSLDPPRELMTGRPAADAAALDEWHRVAHLLVNRGQVTAVDRGVLVAYALKFGQWVALEQEAARNPFVVKTPTGYPMPNPAHAMANKALSLVLKAAAELGITPSSRSRVGGSDAVDHSPANPLAKFLKRA